MNAFLQTLLHTVGAGIVQHWAIMLLPFLAVFLFVKYGSAKVKPSSIYHLLVFFQCVNALVLLELWLGFTAFNSDAITNAITELLHHTVLTKVLTALGSLYCFLGIFYLAQWIRLEMRSKKNTKNLPIAQPWLQQFTVHTCRELGIRQKVTVHTHPTLQVPFTTGFLKPIIVLPLQCVSALNGVQLQAIILHELVHVYRNDYLVSKLLLACQRLVFFNPITHWVHHRIDEFRELAVDEKVVAHTHNKLPYAEALYLIGHWAQKNSTPFQLAATGTSKSNLKQRIQQIIHGNTYQNSPVTKLLTVLLVVLCFCTISLVQTKTNTPLSGTVGNKTIAAPATAVAASFVVNKSIAATDYRKPAATVKTKTRKKLPAKAAAEYVESSFPDYAVTAANYQPELPVPAEVEEAAGKTIISIQRNAVIDSLKVPQNIIFEIGKEKLKRARL